MGNAELITLARDAVVAEYPPASARTKAEMGYQKSVINRLADALEETDRKIALARIQNAVPFEAWDNPRNIAIAMSRVLGDHDE